LKLFKKIKTYLLQRLRQIVDYPTLIRELEMKKTKSIQDCLLSTKSKTNKNNPEKHRNDDLRIVL
jgi:hypothetical protein